MTFEEAILTYPERAYEHFMLVDPSFWNVSNAGSYPAEKMVEKGWRGPYSLKVDGQAYDVYGNPKVIGQSANRFLLSVGLPSVTFLECPNCGETLELPSDVGSRHVRCPYCEDKFVVSDGVAYAIEADKGRPKAIVVKDIAELNKEKGVASRPFDLSVVASFRSLCESKDLSKYKQLFMIAPGCVKVAAVLILLQVALSIMTQPTSASSKANYSFAFITVWLLGGILKASNASRWALMGLRAFALLAAPIFAVWAADETSVRSASWFSDLFLGCLWTFVTSIPYVVALFLPKANKWFHHELDLTEKLRKCVIGEKHGKIRSRLMTSLGIAIFVLVCALGKVFLGGMIEGAEKDRQMLVSAVERYQRITADYSRRAKENSFGKVLDDKDLLLGRKEVAITKWRIGDAKDLLSKAISDTEREMNRKYDFYDIEDSDVASFVKVRNEEMPMLLRYFKEQLALVEQTEKIFYSALMESPSCSEFERQQLRSKYGRYEGYARSRAELQRLVEINDRMMKIGKEISGETSK